MIEDKAPWSPWITGLVAAVVAFVIGALVAVLLDLPGWVAPLLATLAFGCGAGAVWLLRRYEPKPLNLRDLPDLRRDRDQRGGGR